MPANDRLNLARKYRPQSLNEVVGQPNAVKTLSEALKTDRIAPAYLFSGPRGTGKTTCARIFARAAACLAKPTERPCLKCKSCEIDRGQRSIDLLEIDGASHTGVDDIRSIIDAAAYRPAVAAKKVYIIDEVHMLSNAAFNALLKTLEEPPANALFLFATTEPEKIPSTILSRVQRIEMLRLKEAEIKKNLEMICSREKILADAEAIDQIAIAADGGLRDAQTLLEQMTLMSGGEKISLEVCDLFLGTIGSQRELDLLQSIAKRDTESILKQVQTFDEKGKDLQKLLLRLVEWSRSLLILKSTSKIDFIKSDFSEDQIKTLSGAFHEWSVEDTDRLFETLWLGVERMRKSESPRITCDMTLLRAARIPHTEDLRRLLNFIEATSAQASGQRPSSAQINTPPSASASYSAAYDTPSARSSQTHGFKPTPSAQPPASSFVPATNLQGLLGEVRKRRPTVHALLVCADQSQWTDDTLTLHYPPAHFAFKQLSEKILNKEVEDLLTEISAGKCKVLKLNEGLSLSKSTPPKVSGGRNFMKDAKTSILSDPAILKATQVLNGKIESVTIEGVKNS